MAIRKKGKSQPEMPTRKTLIAEAVLSIYKETAMNTEDAFAFAFMQQQSAIAAAMNTTATDKETAMTATIDTTTAADTTLENAKENAMTATIDTTTAAATETVATETAATAPSLGAMLAKRLGYTAKENEVDEPVSAPKTETDPEAVFWNAVERFSAMRDDAPNSYVRAIQSGEIPVEVLNEIARRDAIVAQNSMFGEAAESEETLEETLEESDAPSSLDDLASNAEDSLYDLIHSARSIAFENQKLLAQLEALAALNAALETENAALKAQVAEQQASLESKDALIDEMRGSINEQSEEIASKASLIAALQHQLEANDLILKHKAADEAAALEMARLAESEANALKATLSQRNAELEGLKAAVNTASNDAVSWAKAAHDAAAKAAVLQEKLANIAKMLS